MFTLKPATNSQTNASIPGAAKVYQAVPDKGIIDVLTDFTFTASPISQYIRDKLPYIVLTEYELEYNSTLASALYYTKIIPQEVGKLKTFAEEQLNSVKKDSVIAGLSKKLVNGVASGVNSLNDAVQSFANIDRNGSEFPEDVLTPYNGLYLRKATNFTYILPFFDNKKRSINNNWGDAQTGLQGKSGITELVDAGQDLMKKYLGTTMFSTPGAFIESPKFYNLPDGETIIANFQLINTINPDDYQKHYDFLFL
ncbi:hypothetical protein EBU95_21790, partial [bacterium]|nr:hypothetical protein [bacterium]